MAKRKFAATWDDIAYIDADHIARWGALAGFTGQITFDDCTPATIGAEHDPVEDRLTASYAWTGASGIATPVRSAVALKRRPCPFGGARAYFICPRCSGRTLRLAVLPAGLRCGRCGNLTWASRRETETQRLVRRANKLARRLGLDCFADAPARPPRMRASTYAGIISALTPLIGEIERRAAARMARAGCGFTAMATLARWGL